MANQFAVPTFISGLKENLAVVDTYQNSVRTTINSATSAFGLASDLVDNLINNAKPNTDKLKLFVDTVNSSKQLSPDALVKKLETLNPVIGKSVTTINSLAKMSANALNTFKKYSDTANQVMAEVNGIKAIFSGRNFDSVQSIASAVKQLSSNNFPLVIKDTKTVIGVNSAVINGAIDAKIPGALTAISYTITDPVVKSGVVKEVTQTVINNSDISALDELASDPDAVHLIEMHNPDVLGDFAAKYVTPLGVTASDLKALGNKAIATFNKINPNWQTTTRNGVEVTCTRVTDNASDEFRSLIASSDYADDAIFFTQPVVPVTDTSTSEDVDKLEMRRLMRNQQIHLESINTTLDKLPPQDTSQSKYQLFTEKDGFAVYENIFDTFPKFVKTPISTSNFA